MRIGCCWVSARRGPRRRATLPFLPRPSATLDRERAPAWAAIRRSIASPTFRPMQCRQARSRFPRSRERIFPTRPAACGRRRAARRTIARPGRTAACAARRWRCGYRSYRRGSSEQIVWKATTGSFNNTSGDHAVVDHGGCRPQGGAEPGQFVLAQRVQPDRTVHCRAWPRPAYRGLVSQRQRLELRRADVGAIGFARLLRDSSARTAGTPVAGRSRTGRAAASGAAVPAAGPTPPLP